MNSAIMQISSSYIYADELIADDSVKERCIKDLPRVNGQSPADEMNSVLEDELNALIWIDTAGKAMGDCEEDQGKADDGSTVPLPAVLQTASKFNPGEVEIVTAVYKDLRENQRLGIDDIGIIAPYKAQVDLIRNSLTTYEGGKPRSEVSTVDGFQGREKEVIVLSMTRSNPNREVGFLSDVRRLNVAITRPKRLLIIIGDSQTVKSDPFINEIYSKVQLHGKIMGIYDFLAILKSNGEDDSAIRAHFNSGTHQTNVLYKVKEKTSKDGPNTETDTPTETKSGGKKKKAKKEQPKEDGAKLAEPAIVAQLDLPKPPKNNDYGISFDLFSRIEVLLKWKDDASEPCPEPIKIYGKLEDLEKQGLEVFYSEHKETVEVKIATKPKHVLSISRVVKKATNLEEEEEEEEAEEGEGQGKNPEEGMMESKPDPEEEKRRKNAEKRQRQKEARRKQKEEEERLAQMPEEEYLAMLLKEKESKMADMKLCQATIGNTGKKCLKNIQLLGIVCKFCEVKFCASHAFASMHGCDEAEEDFYEQRRKEQLRGLRGPGAIGGFSKNDPTAEQLQEKLRKMKQEAEEKRKPKTKEEESKGGSRGGRGGRGTTRGARGTKK